MAALGYAGFDEEPSLEEPALGPASPLPHDPGPLLLTDERDLVQLLDRSGEELWSLRVPGRSAVELAEPLPLGALATLSVDEGVDVFDSAGKRVASWDLACHHDLAREAQGALLLAVHADRPYHGRQVRFDRIVRVHPDQPGRQPELVWDSFEARVQLIQLAGLSVLDEPAADPDQPSGHGRYDRFHLNSIQVLPPSGRGQRDPRFAPDNLLLCLRNASLLLVIDPSDGRIQWSYGPGELDFPHHPTLLPSGRILVFDNGFHRSWSRLVELDPGAPGAQTNVAWDWRAADPPAFHSPTRGAAERLAGGQTLVTDSESGRLFELDPAGRVTWRWLRPLEPDGRRRRIYRATRPSDVWVASSLAR